MKMICRADRVEEQIDFDLKEVKSIRICRAGDVATPEELRKLEVRPDEVVLYLTFGRNHRCLMRPGWEIRFEEEKGKRPAGRQPGQADKET